MGTIRRLNPVRRYRRRQAVTRLVRLGIGFATGVAVGVTVYELIKAAREDQKLETPRVKGGRVIRYPSRRPPYAEAAQTSPE